MSEHKRDPMSDPISRPSPKMASKKVKERIPDRYAAMRCVGAVVSYLRRHESPLAAEDLEYSITLLKKGTK